MKFLSVIHTWHVNSKGFKVSLFQRETMDEAQLYHDALVHRATASFTSAAGELLQIADSESVIFDQRKLTWKERLTGRIRQHRRESTK